MAGAGARLGVNSPSMLQGQGSVFGLGVSQGGCEEEVCEVGDNDSSVT